MAQNPLAALMAAPDTGAQTVQPMRPVLPPSTQQLQGGVPYNPQPGPGQGQQQPSRAMPQGAADGLASLRGMPHEAIDRFISMLRGS